MTAAKDIEDVEAVKSLIQAFFDTINANDPKALQHLFVPNANLTIVRQDPPKPPPSCSEWSSLPLPSPAISTPTSSEKDSLHVVVRITIENFIKMVEDGEKKKKGKPPGPKVHEVPDLDATDVKLDACFAAAWSPFSVTFDGVLHHYGSFVFTLGKTHDTSQHAAVGGRLWKFEGLTQNYRRTPGWESESFDFVPESKREGSQL